MVQVCIFLDRMATAAPFRSLSRCYGVASNTCSLCVRAVTNAIVDHLLPRHIRLPEIKEEMGEAARRFAQRRGIRGVVGAIDGSHIKIDQKHGSLEYLNRKAYHSILLQGVVDCDKRFIDVNCGWLGLVHDVRVFSNCALKDKIDVGWLAHTAATVGGVDVPFQLIGDAAYTGRKHVLTPVKADHVLTEDELEYNQRHSGTRIPVECAFGVLKGKWRALCT